MGTTKSRMFRVQWLLNKINVICDLGKTCDKDKLIAEFCLFFGSSRRSALEYLDNLVNSNKIHLEGNEIYSIDAWNEENLLRTHSQETKPSDDSPREISDSGSSPDTTPNNNENS